MAWGRSSATTWRVVLGVTFPDGVDGTAWTDGGQLPLITDQHELRTGPFDPHGEAQQVRIRGHGGLVKDHHRAVVEGVVVVVEAPQQ